MSVYYNEFDPMAAEWLRYLMVEGLIPMGEVDERSIIDVQPEDLEGYTQCHFFAGIGGWAYALQLAGWGDRPVWTGSCPCQPFSAAGKQKGVKDVRHLWPEFGRLIEKCQPPVVFGEQVASKLGREWLAGVFADLESVGYAVAGADLCAASVNAPHIRQRLWWVADAECNGRRADEPGREAQERTAVGRGGGRRDGGLADREADGRQQECPVGPRRAERSGAEGRASGLGLRGAPSGLGNAEHQGPQGQQRSSDLELHGEAGALRPVAEAGVSDAWSDCIWLPCADGKARRIEPGTAPLAHGVSGRVAQLRGLGNAIVPQVAAAFIEAYLEIE